MLLPLTVPLNVPLVVDPSALVTPVFMDNVPSAVWWTVPAIVKKPLMSVDTT
jgi:hypothetical protein